MKIHPADVPVPESGGPAMDEYGFPVQPPSKTLAYLLMAGELICALGAAGFGLAGLLRGNNHALVVIGIGLSVMSLGAEFATTSESKKPRLVQLTQARAGLGPFLRRVLKIGLIANAFILVALMGTFVPAGSAP